MSKKKISKVIPAYSTGLSRADQIAKIMLNKYGISVKAGQNPCVDLKTNTIYIPPYDENNDKDVENMIHYITHEVGHIKFSDDTELRGIKFKILNILEDQRVNAKQEFRYPGINFKPMYNRIIEKMDRANKQGSDLTKEMLDKLVDDETATVMGMDKEKIIENEAAMKNLNAFMSALLLNLSGTSKVKIKDLFHDKDWWEAYEKAAPLLDKNYLSIPSSSLLEGPSEEIFEIIEPLLPENFENEMTSSGAHVVPMPMNGGGGESDQEGKSPLSEEGGSFSENGFHSEDLGEKTKDSSLCSNYDPDGSDEARSYSTAKTDKVLENTTFHKFSPVNLGGGWAQKDKLEIRSKFFYNRFLDLFIAEDQQEYEDGFSSGRLKKIAKVYTSPKPFSKISSGVSHEKVSVTILVDYSGSMGGYEQNLFEVGGSIALALSKLSIPHQLLGYDNSWGDDCIIDEIIPFSTHFTSAMSRKLESKRAGGGTPTGEALCYCLEKFIIPQPGAKKLVFLITDGCPNNSNYTLEIVERFQRYKNIKLTGVGIGHGCRSLLESIPDALLMEDQNSFKAEGQAKFFRDLEKFFLSDIVV